MKRRILVIDDDVSVRDALKKILNTSGYSVQLASDGREGADSLAQDKFDLLVLDLDLPEVSGFDILDIVAERDASLPIVILTGMAGQCEAGSVAGADALLEKPPDVWLLLNTIERLLGETSAERLERLAHGPPPPHPVQFPQRTSQLLWRTNVHPRNRSLPRNSA
ncbi:MAG TPA: response regulator [Verrucomicrobiae bacterium]|nr:response regulator [Verrucomicrobiae bacterium]